MGHQLEDQQWQWKYEPVVQEKGIREPSREHVERGEVRQQEQGVGMPREIAQYTLGGKELDQRSKLEIKD